MIVLRVEFRGMMDAQPQFVVEAPPKGETPETESLAQWVNALNHREGVRRLRQALLEKCRELAPGIKETEPTEAEPPLARDYLVRLLREAKAKAESHPALNVTAGDTKPITDAIGALGGRP